MEKLITFILIIFFAANIYAQDKITKSLKHELAISKKDTSRALTMVHLSWEYALSNPDSSLFYGEQAYKFSTEINFPQGQILALGFESLTLNTIGNLPRSLELGIKSLQIAADNQLEEFTAPALNSIGSTYFILKDYPKALKYFRRQQAIVMYSSDRQGLGYGEVSIGEVFLNLNQFDSAAYYLKKGDADLRRYGRIEPLITADFGEIQMKLGNYPAALALYQKSLQLSIQNNEQRAICQNYNSISKLYKKINQPDSAIFMQKRDLPRLNRFFKKGKF